MNMFPIDDHLVMIIDRLNAAVNVCHGAPEKEDQGYAYATGYARSAMTDVANDLSNILNEIREEMDTPWSVHQITTLPTGAPIIST